MNQDRMLEILKETGAYQEGHFKLSSGLHSDTYIQCARLLQYPWLAQEVIRALGDLFQDEAIDIVVGPAIGGILVAYEMGRALEKPAIFAERENGIMTLRRGFHVAPATKCLVTEDVLTTGGSAQEVVDLLQSLGAQVVGAASIIDRTAGNTLKLHVPFKSLLTVQAQTYDPQACPLCQAGKPIEKPGSRPAGA